MSIHLLRHGVAASARPAASSALIFKDQFTAADGTAISGRTAADPTNVSGNPWVIANGASTILSNRMVFGSSNSRIIRTDGISDGWVIATLRHGSASSRSPHLYFRSSDVASGFNAWRATIHSDELRLTETVAGTSVVRQSVAMTNSLSTDYLVWAELNGPSIKIWFNGVVVITHSSAVHQSNTYHGAGCTSDAAVQIDNFEVWTP